jgi:hypothetical protein
VGCGKCRRTAQVGLPRLSPSLCLERWAGRAFCLGRWMGVCLRLHPGRWPQGEGRSAVWCGGRWRVLPLGRMKRVILQVWAGRVLPMWIRATRRQALGVRLQGGWRPALWLGGGRMRAGWDGGSPSRAGLCAGGRTKQPLCVRRPSGTGLLAGGCGQRPFVPEAACRGSVCSPRFGCEAGRRSEGRRRRSGGQTGLGLGRQAQRTTQTGWRPSGSGPGAGGEAGGKAVWPEAPTRERCAASSSEARR